MYLADELNLCLMELVKAESDILIDSVVEVLLTHLKHEKTECRVATLNWIRHLHLLFPNKVTLFYKQFESLFINFYVKLKALIII